MISTATNILVSEPMRYWVFPSGSWSSIMLREPHHTWTPSLTTAPTSDGVRPSACPVATRRSSARRVAGSNSSGSRMLGDLLHGLGELCLVQPRVRAARREQLRMGSLLDDVPVLHHQDQVGVADGG